MQTRVEDRNWKNEKQTWYMGGGVPSKGWEFETLTGIYHERWRGNARWVCLLCSRPSVLVWIGIIFFCYLFWKNKRFLKFKNHNLESQKRACQCGVRWRERLLVRESGVFVVHWERERERDFKWENLWICKEWSNRFSVRKWISLPVF